METLFSPPGYPARITSQPRLFLIISKNKNNRFIQNSLVFTMEYGWIPAPYPHGKANPPCQLVRLDSSIFSRRWHADKRANKSGGSKDSSAIHKLLLLFFSSFYHSKCLEFFFLPPYFGCSIRKSIGKPLLFFFFLSFFFSIVE